MSEKTKVLVTGAGGFIGHHLTKYLIDRGYFVRGFDRQTRLDQATLVSLMLPLIRPARTEKR